jgi:hypothetical protein
MANYTVSAQLLYSDPKEGLDSRFGTVTRKSFKRHNSLAEETQYIFAFSTNNFSMNPKRRTI